MQFSDTTNKTGLVEDISFLIFGDSNDHTADYPLVDVARNVNRWYDKAVTHILHADTRWEWDDTNKTDLPIARIDIVAGQQDYGVSSATYLKVSRIDMQDQTGNWIQLQPFNQADINGRALNDFLSTPGVPRYFRIQANSIFLYPIPNYAFTKGIRVFYQRNVDYFVATDTTKLPGFAEIFHRYLSLGSAYEYAQVHGMTQKRADLRAEITLIETDMENFYSTRNMNKVSLSLHRPDYGETTLGLDGSGQGGLSQDNPFGFF